MNEYFIGEFLFDDDPLLSSDEKSNTHVPGGNGVMKLEEKNGILSGVRNIYLGRDILNYPVSLKTVNLFYQAWWWGRIALPLTQLMYQDPIKSDQSQSI